MKENLSKSFVREPKIEYVGESSEMPIADTSLKASKILCDFCANHEFFDPEVEHFFVLSLDAKNKVKGINLVTKGTATSSLAPIRETLRYAILLNSAAIIIAHNHPSGSAEPSRNDIEITRQFKKACDIMRIDFLDHVIFTADSAIHYSFQEKGLI